MMTATVAHDIEEGAKNDEDKGAASSDGGRDDDDDDVEAETQETHTNLDMTGCDDEDANGANNAWDKPCWKRLALGCLVLVNTL
jgi:hypothetical protein